MELLEGAPLSDYIASMEEKGSRFGEDHLWRVFAQLLLALRYLHKDRKIIHRDLSPANLMLNEDDKLTISKAGRSRGVVYYVGVVVEGVVYLYGYQFLWVWF